MQLAELHAWFVYRSVLKAAHDPNAPLDQFKAPIKQLAYSLSLAGSASLFLVYIYTPMGWHLGVLAGVGAAAAFFVPFAKHDGAVLYSTLGIVIFAMFLAVLTRSYLMNEFTPEAMGAPLALTVFLGVTTFAIAANARVETL